MSDLTSKGKLLLVRSSRGSRRNPSSLAVGTLGPRRPDKAFCCQPGSVAVINPGWFNINPTFGRRQVTNPTMGLQRARALRALQIAIGGREMNSRGLRWAETRSH